jgi:hypothetical protein
MRMVDGEAHRGEVVMAVGEVVMAVGEVATGVAMGVAVGEVIMVATVGEVVVGGMGAGGEGLGSCGTMVCCTRLVGSFHHPSSLAGC